MAKSKSIKGRIIAIVAIAVVAVLAIAGVGVANAVKNGGKAPTIVRVGVDGDSTNDLWDTVNQVLAAQNANIKVETVKMDGSQINGATDKKDLDLNAFQHRAYLDDQIAQNGYNLEVFAETFVSPLNVYSNKIKSLDELKDGATIAVPANPTNLGRALQVLQAGGVLKTDPSKGYLPTVTDITDNPKHIQIKQVDAYQIPKLLPDVDAGIINSGVAVDAGISPTHDSIYSVPVVPGDEYNKPWANLIVGRKGEGNNEVYRKIVEAYGSPEVKKVMQEKHSEECVYAYRNLLQ